MRAMIIVPVGRPSRAPLGRPPGAADTLLGRLSRAIQTPLVRCQDTGLSARTRPRRPSEHDADRRGLESGTAAIVHAKWCCWAVRVPTQPVMMRHRHNQVPHRQQERMPHPKARRAASRRSSPASAAPSPPQRASSGSRSRPLRRHVGRATTRAHPMSAPLSPPCARLVCLLQWRGQNSRWTGRRERSSRAAQS